MQITARTQSIEESIADTRTAVSLPRIPFTILPVHYQLPTTRSLHSQSTPTPGESFTQSFATAHPPHTDTLPLRSFHPPAPLRCLFEATARESPV